MGVRGRSLNIRLNAADGMSDLAADPWQRTLHGLGHGSLCEWSLLAGSLLPMSTRTHALLITWPAADLVRRMYV